MVVILIVVAVVVVLVAVVTAVPEVWIASLFLTHLQPYAGHVARLSLQLPFAVCSTNQQTATGLQDRVKNWI